MKKQYLLVWAFIMLSIPNIFGQWTMNGPTGAATSCVYHSGNDFYAGTFQGVYKSSNEGTTWTKIGLGPYMSDNIQHIGKCNNDLYASGGYRLYKTSDEGATWETLPFYEYVTSITVANNTVIVGTYNGVYKSSDGGENWDNLLTGYSTCVYYDPASGLLYSASAGDGFQRSSDLGATWTVISGGPSNSYALLADNNKLIAAGSPNTISYDNGLTWQTINTNNSVGTGLAKFNNDFYLATANGLYKSTDQGSSWTYLALPNADKVVQGLTSSNTYLMASGSSGIYRQNTSNSWGEANAGIFERFIPQLMIHNNKVFAISPSGGVYKTSDEGQTWTQKINNLGTVGTWSQASFNNALYLGTNAGIYKSTDEGDSWQLAYTASYVQEMKVINNVLYACNFGGIYRSTDGTTWTSVAGNLVYPYVNTITNLGTDLYIGTFGEGVYKSVDNGSSWQQVINGLSDMYIMKILGYNGMLYAGSSDGIYTSVDQGATWAKMTNLGIGQVYDIIPYNNYAYACGGGGVSKILAGTSCYEVYTINNGYQYRATSLAFLNNKVYTAVYSYFGNDPSAVYVQDQSAFTPVYSPPGTPTVTGSSVACTNGQNYVYSVPATSVNNYYEWTVPAGAEIISGDYTNSITVNYTNFTTAGAITVTEVSPTCHGQAVSFNVTPQQTAANIVITGNTTPCANAQNQSYSVPSNAGNTYNWSFPSGTTIVSGNGANSILVNIGTVGGAVSVTETNSHACVTSSAPFTITLSAPPVLTSISGANLYCADERSLEDYYALPYVAGVGYVWTVNNGGSVGIQQNNLARLSLSSSQASHVLTVKTVSLQGCESNTITKTVNRKINISPISGPSTVCTYSNGNIYSVTDDLSGASYFWDAFNSSIASGNGTPQISMTASFQTGTIPLSVLKYDAAGCKARSNLSVTNKYNLGAIGVNGTVNVCPNQTGAVYTTTSMAGASYQWTVPPGATIVSGANTNSITVNYSGFNTLGTVTAQLSHPNYCTPVSASLTVNGTPNFSSSINGPAKVCANAQLIGYNIFYTPGSTYTWAVPANAYIISGQGGRNIVVSYNNFTSGNITVVETLAGGCSSNPIVLPVSSVSISTGYDIPSVTASCNSGTFNIQVNTLNISSGIKSFNIGIVYDPTIITPTSSPTKYVPGPVLTSAGGVANLTQNYFNQPVNATTSVFLYSAYIKTTGTFSGGGNVISFPFDLNPSAPVGSITPIIVSSLQEGLEIGGQTAVCPATTGTVSIVNYETLLKGKILLNNSATALGYDATNPTLYNLTAIEGSTGALCGTVSYSTLPDAGGNFDYNVSTGDYIRLKRDIANSVDVTGYLNAADASRINQIAAGSMSPVPTIYDMLAADVDMSGYVNGNDALFLAQRVVNGSFTQQPVAPALDWLFLDNTTLNTNPYKKSATYPLSDGIGFSLSAPLPAYSACLPVRKVSNASCTDIPAETYRGIMIGDLSTPRFSNQSNSHIKTSDVAGYTAAYGSGSMVIDLSRATATENNSYLIPVFQFAGDTALAFDVNLDYDESSINIINVRNAQQEAIYAWNSKFNNERLLICGFTPEALPNGTPVYFIEVSSSSSLLKDHWGSFRAKVNGSEVEAIVKTSEGQNVMNDLFVYPNPATDRISLSASPLEFTVEITSVKGELVYTGKNETDINISTLSSGLYIITVKSEEGTKRFKFSKLK